MSVEPQAASPPLRRRSVLRRFGLAMALAALAIAGGGWLAVARPWEVKPIVVSVTTLVPETARRLLALSGRVVAASEVEIHSSVTAKVVAVTAAEGAAVATGGLLAQLDDSQQQAAVDQASAALDTALTQLQQAQNNLDRANELAEIITRKEREIAEVAVNVARSDVQRQISLRSQELVRLAEYRVRAPFDGTVLKRSVDRGQIVDPTTALFTFAALQNLQVEATVDEVFAAQVSVGMPVRLQPVGSARVIDETVSYVAASVDPSTGGRKIRIAIGGMEPTTLPVGLTTMATLIVAETPEALMVPRTAILDSRTSPAVLLAIDGRAVRRPIEFTDWPADQLIVTSGLAAGDRVIVDAGRVGDGDLVKIVGQ